MDFTLKQISDFMDVILVIGAAIGAFALMVYKQHRLTKEQEKMSEKQGEMSEKQAVMAREVELIWSGLKEMGKKLDKILQSHPKSATQGESPVKLTKVGHEISDALGAPAILKELKEQLKNLVFAEGKPSNAYDLQEKAFNVAKQELPNLLKPEDLDAAKNAGYKRDLLLSEVMMVFGVLLRDMLMKEEGFPDLEADQHETNNPNNAS